MIDVSFENQEQIPCFECKGWHGAIVVATVSFTIGSTAFGPFFLCDQHWEELVDKLRGKR